MDKGWIVFYDKTGEILRISKNGLSKGEIGMTIGLLAYERGLCVSEISFAEMG